MAEQKDGRQIGKSNLIEENVLTELSARTDPRTSSHQPRLSCDVAAADIQIYRWNLLRRYETLITSITRESQDTYSKICTIVRKCLRAYRTGWNPCRVRPEQIYIHIISIKFEFKEISVSVSAPAFFR